MKAAFFFDTYLLKKDFNYYGMTLTYDFFTKKYLKFFDEIIVSTRFKSIYEEDGDYRGYKKVNGRNVKVIPIENYKVISDIIKSRKIKKEINNIIKKVDKVIVRMPSVIGMYALNICKKTNKDYLVEMVSCPLDGYYNHTNSIGKIIAPFMYFFTKQAIKNARNVLYVTNKFLQDRYPSKGNSYSCSDVEIDSNEKILKTRIDKIKNISNDISLLTVGNVGMKYKGHKYVIKALSKIKSNINYRYYLIGNGNFNELKKLSIKYGISDKIIFLGSMSHEKVLKKLEEVDIYIQPSLQEGLPRALIEAMSVGCPCIGSNVGGIPELLDSQCVFRKKDCNDLVSKLQYMNKKNMLLQAKRNYEISLNYNKKKLDVIRNKIYRSF